MKLHLGCSDDYREGFTNVDRLPRNAPAAVDYQPADLNAPWPWPDSSVEHIVANDVFEHISGIGFTAWLGKDDLGNAAMRFSAGVSPKIHVLNEAHRVLVPGGLLEFSVPCVYLIDADGRPNGINPGAFADPTHVSYWTWDDQFYFAEQFNHAGGERGRMGPDYGITAVFRFPKIVETTRGWETAIGQPDPELLWKITRYGNGRAQRTKLIARIKAVK